MSRASLVTNFALFITFVALNGAQASVIILYGPCDEGLYDVLHTIHSTTLNYSPVQTLKNDGDDENHISAIRNFRQYRNNTCSWISDDTTAILVVSETNATGQEIMKTADQVKMPYLIMADTDGCKCSNNSVLSFSDQPLTFDLPEHAVFSYLEQENLEDVLIVHEKGSIAGLRLSLLLNSASVRVTHMELADHFEFFKNVETFFDPWNLTSLSHVRRRLVVLDNGEAIDIFLEKLIVDIMENVRARLLVVDSPERWMRRLARINAYEVDIVVVSNEKTALKQCPVAIEILPYKLHSKEPNHECKPLTFRKRSKGESLLLDIRDDLARCCTSPKYSQYAIWKNFPSEAGIQSLKLLGVWSPSLGILGTEIIDFSSFELKIAVLKYPPYILMNETKDAEIILAKCVLAEILEHLIEKLNLKYKFVSPNDQEFGYRKANGKWTGAVGMVLEGEADVVPFLTVTPRRTKVIDFSASVASTYYGMLVASPSEPPRTFIFLRPFTKEVWIATMVAAIVMSIVLNQIHVLNQKFSGDYKGRQGLTKYTNCLWCIFCPMVQQSSIHLPNSVSGRLILSTWCLALLVIVSTYSAKLIAFLAFPEAKWVVETLADLAEHKSVLLMIDEGCPLLEDLRKSQLTVYKEIREIYLNNPKRGLLVKTAGIDIAEIVSRGRVVFVDDVNYLAKMVEDDYKKTRKCRVTIAPGKFTRMINAMGFRRGSSMMPRISRELKLMGESGILNHWKAKYSGQHDECLNIKTTIRASYDEVGYSDVQGAFHLLVFGVAASVGFLALEIIRQRLNYFKQHYYKL